METVRYIVGVLVLAVAGVAALMTVRDRLLLQDLGTHPALVVFAGILLGLSMWLAILRRRHLGTRTLAGVPELENDAGELLDSGVYARIRHPRYVEVVVGTWAYALFANYLGAYVMAALTLPVIHLIVLIEEQELVERFGPRYEAYRARVPRYLPSIPRRP